MEKKKKDNKQKIKDTKKKLNKKIPNKRDNQSDKINKVQTSSQIPNVEHVPEKVGKRRGCSLCCSR